MSEDPTIYGYEITYERRLPDQGLCGARTEEVRCRCKGTEATARRYVTLKKNFARVVLLDPYTRAQWLRCFGEGRM